MFPKESRTFDPTKVPDGCQDASQELESIQWIVSSVNRLERIPSCKRRDALKVVLTEMLEDPTLPSYSELPRLLAENARLWKQNELLNTQISSLNETKSDLETDLLAITQEQHHEVSLLHRVHVPRPVFWVWVIGTMILGLMVYSLFGRVVELGAT